jgi:hypothetical protein
MRGRGPSLTFRIEPAVSRAGEKRTFEIYRDGWGRIVELMHATREDAEREAERLEAEEAWGLKAVHDPDPSVLCGKGWHRAFDHAGRRYFFRLRRGWGGCALAYLVAHEPIEYRGRTIGTFNANAIPWRCEACGEAISSEGPRTAISAEGSRSEGSDQEGGFWQL